MAECCSITGAAAYIKPADINLSALSKSCIAWDRRHASCSPAG
jgi:hypothetical protein